MEVDNRGNNAYISYYDVTNGDLKFAAGTWNGSTWDWTQQTVAGAGGLDVGQFTSLAVDDQGNFHVSYYDATNQKLMYASGAVPEASTGLLLGLGLVALAVWRRRAGPR
jgi:hypothetical protein